MARPMKIDFVSDISCPWCVIGLKGLEAALARTGDLVDAQINFQPFELNPDMAPEGEDVAEHIARKYGADPERMSATREMIRSRAADLGFTMSGADGRRLYNTFDAHRLLHWAQIEGRQVELKLALFKAYFTDGQDPSNQDTLVAAAETAGLNGAQAREVLASGRFAQEVRDAEEFWRGRGINGVPAMVIDDRYLISGGQPPEQLEQAIRQIAAEAAG